MLKSWAFALRSRFSSRAPADIRWGSIHVDDLADLWAMIERVKPRHDILQTLVPIGPQTARYQLREVLRVILKHGGTIERVAHASPRDCEQAGHPGYPVALIELGTAPQGVRQARYAAIQVFRRDAVNETMWLALLLADQRREEWYPRRLQLEKPPIAPAPVQRQPAVERQRALPPPADHFLVELLEAPVPVAEPAPVIEPAAPVCRESQPVREDAANEHDVWPGPFEETPDALHEADPFSSEGQVALSSQPADWIDMGDLDHAGIRMVPLSVIAQAENIAIIGPKGSGKTTMLLTLMALRSGEHISLDPHDWPGKWPCQTVGRGRKYETISIAMRRLDAAMSTRFEEMIGDGEGQNGAFPPRTVVSDEYYSIAQKVPEAGDLLLARITEGRKVREYALIAAHNDTVAALGIKGNADMKTCFDWFIYTGALAIQRYRGKAKDYVRQQDHPFVGYDTTKDEWYVLDFDVPPVFAQAAQAPAPLARKDDAPITPGALIHALLKHQGVAIPIQGTTQERIAAIQSERVLRVLTVAATRGVSASVVTDILFGVSSGALRTKVKEALERLKEGT